MTNTSLSDLNTKTRRPHSVDFSEPILTDQSYAAACDINNIMAQYSKTGLLPETTTIPPRYVDNTVIPSLEQAFNIVNSAYDTFYDLPATIRKLMDNDPSQLENFISDANNRDLLLKHGILVAKESPETIQKSQDVTSEKHPKPPKPSKSEVSE